MCDPVVQYFSRGYSIKLRGELSLSFCFILPGMKWQKSTLGKQSLKSFPRTFIRCFPDTLGRTICIKHFQSTDGARQSDGHESRPRDARGGIQSRRHGFQGGSKKTVETNTWPLRVSKADAVVELSRTTRTRGADHRGTREQMTNKCAPKIKSTFRKKKHRIHCTYDLQWHFDSRAYRPYYFRLLWISRKREAIIVW